MSATFDKDISFHVDEAVGSASISPSGRDVVLASRSGLHIIDLDNPYSPPRHLLHRTPWEVADVQWSPFSSRDSWIVSTSNQKALVWNLEMSSARAPIEHTLHAHTRAITDINFSAHNPDMLATCAVDSFVHCWDLRRPARPVMTFADWFAGATQVKYNRQDPHVIASSHDRFLHIWDDRKGSSPLRTIEAHATKIYGIDWSRTSATSLLTCSLDMTIKVWDYPEEESNPKQLIRVPYPVWRARHTPFGWGILAMPQRGNTALHLYDQRLAGDRHVEDHNLQATHSFTGHGNQVKEFLWRSRGGIQDEMDKREFQLVSWGTDRTLMLHHIDTSLLSEVGHRVGQNIDLRFNFTRSGATYKTFRDEVATVRTRQDSMAPPLPGLSSMFADAPKHGFRKMPTTHARNSRQSEHHRSAMQLKARSKKDNAIAWMKGVKINKTEPVSAKHRKALNENVLNITILSWTSNEELGDEISHVGDKYKKVSFERIDVPGRVIRIALNGPWGDDKGLIHIKATIEFPQSYPEISPPVISIEKTSSVSDIALKRLIFGTKIITQAHADHGRGCLEALVRYLLGEKGVSESNAWLSQEIPFRHESVLELERESSSDEDDSAAIVFPRFPSSRFTLATAEPHDHHNPNINVPLPKACGAQWAKDGRLVCFFPRKEQKKPWFNTLGATVKRSVKGRTVFEGLGWLPGMNSNTRLRTSAASSSTDTDFDSDSQCSTNHSAQSTSMDSDDQSISEVITSATKRTHSVIASLKCGDTAVTTQKQAKSSMFVSINDLEDMLPAKKDLAIGYMINGHGPTICAHNATIARSHGSDENGDVWDILAAILADKVPLEILPQLCQSDGILVVARNSLQSISRKGSGLDLGYDKLRPPGEIETRGCVKWADHPSSSWLIPTLFSYFEALGDIQMLAMMSCILSRRDSHGVDAAFASSRSQHLNAYPTVKTTALPVDYFASLEAAWSKLNLDAAQSSVKKPVVLGPTLLANPASSKSHNTEIAPDDFFAVVGNVFALTSRVSRSSLPDINTEMQPPDQERRSSTSFGSSITASFTRSFTLLASTSPTDRIKEQPLLSSSAPTTTAITWGRDVILNANERIRPNSFLTNDLTGDDDSITEMDADEDVLVVDVLLKDQNLLAGGVSESTLLLSGIAPEKLRAYRSAYAHLLNIWDMPVARCELLKYGSSTTYAGSEMPRTLQGPLGLDRSLLEPDTKAESGLAGLEFVVRCPTCGKLAQRNCVGALAKWQCGFCKRTRLRVPCSICNEAVDGLYKGCANCGHIAHFDCLEQWLAENGYLDVECETGCGCFCSEHPMLDLNCPSNEPSDDDG